MHGFDEFFGNLYHLNAEEEPEYTDYPEGPELQEKVRPSWRHEKLGRLIRKTRPIDPVFGKVGKQKIENTGPLTKKRMETVDRGVPSLERSISWSARPRKARPWFCYFNPTRMHVFTHLEEVVASGKPDTASIRDGMVELDGYVGQLLEEA